MQWWTVGNTCYHYHWSMIPQQIGKLIQLIIQPDWSKTTRTTVSSGEPWQCWIEVQAAVAPTWLQLSRQGQTPRPCQTVFILHMFSDVSSFLNKSKLQVVFSDSECQPQVPTCLTLLLESVDHCRCFSRIYLKLRKRAIEAWNATWTPARNSRSTTAKTQRKCERLPCKHARKR